MQLDDSGLSLVEMRLGEAPNSGPPFAEPHSLISPPPAITHSAVPPPSATPHSHELDQVNETAFHLARVRISPPNGLPPASGPETTPQGSEQDPSRSQTARLQAATLTPTSARTPAGGSRFGAQISSILRGRSDYCGDSRAPRPGPRLQHETQGDSGPSDPPLTPRTQESSGSSEGLPSPTPTPKKPPTHANGVQGSGPPPPRPGSAESRAPAQPAPAGDWGAVILLESGPKSHECPDETSKTTDANPILPAVASKEYGANVPKWDFSVPNTNAPKWDFGDPVEGAENAADVNIPRASSQNGTQNGKHSNADARLPSFAEKNPWEEAPGVILGASKEGHTAAGGLGKQVRPDCPQSIQVL